MDEDMMAELAWEDAAMAARAERDYAARDAARDEMRERRLAENDPGYEAQVGDRAGEDRWNRWNT